MTEPSEENTKLKGSCYCGKITFSSDNAPQTVAYCHCKDCRRWTSAPLAAFAAFDEQDVVFTPNEGQRVSVTQGVTRSFCSDCGTPLTGRYDYLPGQVFIGVSVFDQDIELEPNVHSHTDTQLPWLHISDDLERFEFSGRANIGKASKD